MARAATVSFLFGIVACAPQPAVVQMGSGGNGSGGNATGGSGSGGNGSGGNVGSGGSASGGSGSGGSSSGGSGSGGATATGGTTGSAGGSASGGARGGAGGTARGGSTGSGGTAGRGSGGSAAGGRGGTVATGSGGISGTGGAVTSTACTLTNHSGSGSFTHYNFGMGTGKDGSGYRTACGYYGTEGGSSASGPNDTVQNIASMSPASAMYFAAIPGQNGFDSRFNCGACVQITGQNGKMVIATIADECPYGNDGGNTVCGANPNGHLDLSTAVFDQLGYPVGNPSNTNWKFVPCPVTGNIVLQVKNGNNNEFFLQNSILAIKAVSRGSEAATMQNYGAWHFGGALNTGDTLTLTDASNRTLMLQVPGTAMGQNQDTGKQFPTCQ
ncbi:MAG TPA: RlpA-like double-psi beta-barrel domain-containing protein [Polyangia bacterium]